MESGTRQIDKFYRKRLIEIMKNKKGYQIPESDFKNFKFKNSNSKMKTNPRILFSQGDKIDQNHVPASTVRKNLVFFSAIY